MSGTNTRGTQKTTDCHLLDHGVVHVVGGGVLLRAADQRRHGRDGR